LNTLPFASFSKVPLFSMARFSCTFLATPPLHDSLLAQEVVLRISDDQRCVCGINVHARTWEFRAQRCHHLLISLDADVDEFDLSTIFAANTEPYPNTKM
jgi:hypothetical protein